MNDRFDGMVERAELRGAQSGTFPQPQPLSISRQRYVELVGIAKRLLDSLDEHKLTSEELRVVKICMDTMVMAEGLGGLCY